MTLVKISLSCILNGFFSIAVAQTIFINFMEGFKKLLRYPKEMDIMFCIGFL